MALTSKRAAAPPPAPTFADVQSACLRFWSPAIADNGSVGHVVETIKAANLSSDQLFILETSLLGGTGFVGDRRAVLRDIVRLLRA